MEMLGGDVTAAQSIILPEEDEYTRAYCAVRASCRPAQSNDDGILRQGTRQLGFVSVSIHDFNEGHYYTTIRRRVSFLLR